MIPWIIFNCLSNNTCSDVVPIFIGIATILCGILALLSVVSVYEKTTTENTLAEILKKLTLISYSYQSRQTDAFWDQVIEISSGLANYNYIYDNWDKLVKRMKKSNLYCKIVLAGVVFFILSSFSISIENPKDTILNNLLLLIYLSGFAILFSVLAEKLINHLIPCDDENINKYPTPKSTITINHVIDTKIPDVSSTLPFDLFAQSTFLRIYNIDDNGLPTIFSKIKLKINDTEKIKSIALLMLPIDFNLTGGRISFTFATDKEPYYLALNNNNKNFPKDDSIFLIFKLHDRLEKSLGALITVELGENYNLSYTKSKTKDSHDFFPISSKGRSLNNISDLEIIDYNREKQQSLC